MSQPEPGSETAGGAVDLTDPVRDDDHALGPATAAATLLEYGDYECPDCMASFPVVNRLRAELGEAMRFVFRHFPQTSVHPRASVAAQAAEAAGAQGRFWPMHDLLYESRGGLDPSDLDRMALRLNLEVYRFQADLTAGRFVAKVARDATGGRRSGVTGTPTFFVNGRRVLGRDYDALKAAIEQVQRR